MCVSCMRLRCWGFRRQTMNKCAHVHAHMHIDPPPPSPSPPPPSHFAHTHTHTHTHSLSLSFSLSLSLSLPLFLSLPLALLFSYLSGERKRRVLHDVHDGQQVRSICVGAIVRAVLADATGHRTWHHFAEGGRGSYNGNTARGRRQIMNLSCSSFDTN